MHMKTFEKYLMFITFSLAFLGIIGLIPKIISVLLWLSACIYLFLGWKMFSSVENQKLQLIPFLISYLIAQTIITVLFGIYNFPMKIEFSYVTSAFLLIAVILTLIFRRSLVSNYPNNNYLIRLIICFLFSIAPLWMNVIQKG